MSVDLFTQKCVFVVRRKKKSKVKESSYHRGEEAGRKNSPDNIRTTW